MEHGTVVVARECPPPPWAAKARPAGSKLRHRRPTCSTPWATRERRIFAGVLCLKKSRPAGAQQVAAQCSSLKDPAG